MEPITLNERALHCIYGIYCVMFAVTTITYSLRWVCGAEMTNFKLRLKSFWLVVLLFTIALASNRAFAFCFLAFISYLALKEFFSLVQTRRADRRVLAWAYLAIPVQFYFAYIDWRSMFYIFVPLYMFLFIPARMTLIGDTNGFLKSCGTIHWALMTTVYSLGYLAVCLTVSIGNNPAGGGVGILLSVIVLTVLNDFFQFFFGKLFGKRRIIPRVSQNKTWEGFFGGVAATALMAAFLAPYLTPLSLGQGIFAGAGIGVTGFLGDITMSAIKRDIGVKDTGTLLPGHGGILDRLDSLVFTAPLFFHYTAYLHPM